MIRAATRGDVDTITSIAEVYYRENAYEERSSVALDLDVIRRTIVVMIRARDAGIFVSEHDDRIVGVIAGTMQEWFGNPEIRAAQEHIRWTAPGHESSLGDLVDMFDAWARERGAPCAMISCYVTGAEERMRRITSREET